MDLHDYRDTLARCASGVALVTTIDEEGAAIGLTTNTFTPVSLDSRWVIWCIGKNSPLFWEFVHNRYFAISMLSSEQRDLANMFATPGSDNLENLKWQPGIGGVPILENMLAIFQCKNRNQHAAGDHIVLLCEVEKFHSNPLAPLVYCDGEYSTVDPAPILESVKVNVG